MGVVSSEFLILAEDAKENLTWLVSHHQYGTSIEASILRKTVARQEIILRYLSKIEEELNGH